VAFLKAEEFLKTQVKALEIGFISILTCLSLFYSMADSVNARFSVKGANGEVQDVGYRVFLLTALKGFGLDVAMPVNVPGGGVEVTVRGNEKTIRDAVAELRKSKPDVRKVGKVDVSEPVFGSFEFRPFTNDDIQLLTLNQLSKGIPAIVRMDEAVEHIGGDIGDLKTVVTGLNSKYHVISRTLNYQLAGIVLLVLMGFVAIAVLIK
jgi:acylphosphatase